MSFSSPTTNATGKSNRLAAFVLLRTRRANSRHTTCNPRLLTLYMKMGIAFAMAISCLGCVRRSITITTEPKGALVYLNDQEIGQSDVTTDFIWYGDYDVVIRKEGFETLKTHTQVPAPWYQLIPVDFFAEVLWPGFIHDHHDRHFVLAPDKKITSDQLIDQANLIRRRAIEGTN